MWAYAHSVARMLLLAGPSLSTVEWRVHHSAACSRVGHVERVSTPVRHICLCARLRHTHTHQSTSKPRQAHRVTSASLAPGASRPSQFSPSPSWPAGLLPHAPSWPGGATCVSTERKQTVSAAALSSACECERAEASVRRTSACHQHTQRTLSGTGLGRRTRASGASHSLRAYSGRACCPRPFAR